MWSLIISIVAMIIFHVFIKPHLPKRIDYKKYLSIVKQPLKKLGNTIADIAMHPWFTRSFFGLCTLLTFLGILQAMLMFAIIRAKGYSDMTAILTCGVLIVLALNFFYQSVKFTDILSVQKSK